MQFTDENKVKRTLLGILFLLSMKSYSQDPKTIDPRALYPSIKKDQLCVVISGNQIIEDLNTSILKSDFFETGQPIAGVSCKVFGNWESAVSYANENLKNEGKLLVVQGAHGNEMGSYYVNEGPPVSAEKISKHLKDLSGKFHVGSVIHSCYSAEIMNRKLIDDEENDQRLDKLCLITSSSFGRISYGDSQGDIVRHLLKLNKGESLELPFLNNVGGIISSAAWSEVALPEYLMSKATEDGYQALQNMNVLLSGREQCPDLLKSNIALCLSPSITDLTYQDVMNFTDPVVDREVVNNFLSNMNDTIESFNPIHGKSSNALLCYENFFKSYKQKFGDKLERLKSIPQIIQMTETIMGQAYYEDFCLKYRETISDDWTKHALLTGPLQPSVDAYMESLKRLEKKYTQRSFDSLFNLSEFATATFSEKRECTPELQKEMISSKEGIVKSLFGMDFFPNEYVTLLSGDRIPDELIKDRKVSTQIVLKGFQNSDLLRKDLKDPKDQQRRKACQDFKFN